MALTAAQRSARYRRKHRDVLNAKRRAWGKANRPLLREYANGYFRKHYIPRPRKQGKPITVILKENRLRRKADAVAVNATYVRGYLSSKYHIKNAPAALVECIQTLIKIKRQLAYGTTEKHRRIAKRTADSL